MKKNLRWVLIPACVLATLVSTYDKTQAHLPGGTRASVAVVSHSYSNEPQANSLCTSTERIVFSCALKRSAKLVSLCASRDLSKERGYLQYRFGLPGNVELEFPKDRQGSQQKFRYQHYFRYQVDLTEISFESDGYQYSIHDDYNGEEKPPVSTQGVDVTAPGKGKEAHFVCSAKAKADFSILADVLPNEN
jgi:hypothetical protein